MANVRLYHGTDLDSALNLVKSGLDALAAASYNSGGEFWATSALDVAEWFAQSNPAGGSPAIFMFEVPDIVLALLLKQVPPSAFVYTIDGRADYEFLPASFAELNHSACNQHAFALP